ncbi:DUF4817 domain-containing protein [Trichonephila clavipes]|nr:DUF4817 domain-containing protein [Trichonephila clavipes]
MGGFTYAENVDMHYMYGSANGNGRAALRMHHTPFPDQRIFQRIHSQLREKRSFHVTRHDAGRRRDVRSPSLEESLLNVVVDRSESSTTAVAHHVSVSHQIVCRVLNGNRLHIFHFQRVQTLNPANYLRLTVGGTAKCIAVGFHSSCAKQLL